MLLKSEREDVDRSIIAKTEFVTFLRRVNRLLSIRNPSDQSDVDQRFSRFGDEIDFQFVVQHLRERRPWLFDATDRSNDVLQGLFAVFIIDVESTQISRFRCSTIAVRQRTETFQSFGHAKTARFDLDFFDLQTHVEAKRFSPASSEMTKTYSGAETWFERCVRPNCCTARSADQGNSNVT